MCHGPGVLDHASVQVQDPQLPGRLARPGIFVSGDCAGEGLPAVAMSGAGHSRQPVEELLDSHSVDRLSRDEDLDFSFEGFPDSQTGSEAVLSRTRLHILSVSSSYSIASTAEGDVLGVISGSGSPAPHEIPSAAVECGGLSPGGRRSRLLGRLLPVGSSMVVRRLPSTGSSSCGHSATRSLPLHGRF